MHHTADHRIGRRRCADGTSACVARAGLLIASIAGTAVAGVDCDGDGIPDQLQTYIWQSTNPFSSGLWSLQSNWDSIDGGVPGSTDLAVFDGNSGLGLPPYNVQFNGFAAVRGLEVLDVDATFELDGNQLSVLGQQPGCRELLVGGAAGSSLTILGQGGTLSTRRVVIGDGAQSLLKIDHAFHEHISFSPLIVGSTGSGILDLVDGTLLHDGTLIVGDKSSGFGQIDAVDGSKLLFGLEVSSSVKIGYNGYGSVVVRDGSEIQNSPNVSIGLGVEPESFGQLRLPDGGVTHTMSVTEFKVGIEGEGFFEIGDTVTVDMPSNNAVVIGEQPGSRGEALLQGGSLWLLSGPLLDIAPGGSGVLSLGEGGMVDIPSFVRASRDGVIRGSGVVASDVVLRGGAISPTAQFATSSARQQLFVTGNLLFSSPRPGVTEEEKGRMIFTLRSANPSQTMSVAVDGEAKLDGTLRIRVNPGVAPVVGVLYPVVEPGLLSGRFEAIQSPVLTTDLVAQAVYPGDGIAYVRFDTSTAPAPDIDPPIPFGISGTFTDGVLRDVNDDGYPDLLAVMDEDLKDGNPGLLVVALNLGPSGAGNQWLGFDQPQSFSSHGLNPVALATGDMNQDGAPDVVVANRDESSDQVRILLNDPTNPGDFSALAQRTVTLPGAPVDLTLADINGTGKLDIITVYDPFFLRGSGGGINTSEDDGGGFDDNDGDTGDDPGSVDSMGGEFEPNGIAATSKSEASVYTFGNAAATTARGGSFPLESLQQLPAGRDPQDMFTEDLNGDGLDEIITSDAMSGSISIQIAVTGDEGMTIYGPAVSLRASESDGGGQPQSVVAVDLNGDNLTDIAYIASNDNGARDVYGILNLGRDDDEKSLLFSRPKRITPDGVGGPSPVILIVADVDKNGRDDLVTLANFNTEGSQGVSAYLAAGAPCNAADLALPYGVLDLGDLSLFVSAFMSQDPAADLAPPFDLLDLGDINAFIGAFTAGCP